MEHSITNRYPIDKIVVHHKEKLYGKTYQQVEIYYRFVGELKGTVAKAA